MGVVQRNNPGDILVALSALHIKDAATRRHVAELLGFDWFMPQAVPPASVPPDVPKPPSLRNLLKELHDDLGVPVPDHGTLTAWARRGVLLLNTVLTVREGEAASHAGRGWERFTDAVVERVTAKRNTVVFLLLGNHAQKKVESVDLSGHAVVTAPHPSPLSARRGFFGSRVFSRVDARLVEGGRDPVDWSL